MFSASDYNSKTTFKQFLLAILNIFRKFNGEMPLQFILFTHDELVFDSALDAISEFESMKTLLFEERIEDEQWKSPIENRTSFARLFSAKDTEESPSESQFGKYWDLTYKIPTQLEHLLKVN